MAETVAFLFSDVISYRDTDLPIPQIARKLSAGTVIEGAVKSAGRRIRLSVQVIDGINDVHRWAETYDRELTTEGLFDIQSELAAGRWSWPLRPPVRTAPSHSCASRARTAPGRFGSSSAPSACNRATPTHTTGTPG